MLAFSLTCFFTSFLFIACPLLSSSFSLPFFPDPKHPYPSLSFGSPSCSPKRATVWEFGCQARTGLCWEAPVVHLAPFPPRDINTEGQIISDIADDMWKLSIVETLEKTCLRQSLRIKEDDKRGLKGRKMDSRNGVNGCNPRPSAFDSLWGHLLPFLSLFHDDLPVPFRKLTPA